MHLVRHATGWMQYDRDSTVEIEPHGELLRPVRGDDNGSEVKAAPAGLVLSFGNIVRDQHSVGRYFTGSEADSIRWCRNV